MPEFEKGRSRLDVGIAATLLDGKACLRQITDEADAILFGPKPGSYDASSNEQVVVIVFDDPQAQGVIFMQGP